MKISDVKRVAIVGLARQGIALARFFCSLGAHVIVTDLRSPEQLRQELAVLEGLPIEYVLSDHPFALLDGCDLLCLSGGVPPETPLPQEARRLGIPLSNDSLLTLHLASTPMLGITGSSGKTTTTTLVGEMLQATLVTSSQGAGKTWVGGNIGTPLIDRIDDIAAGDKMVLELSSFQLQLFDASPHVSAVLNVTPNHLDRHPSMAHYTAAKANILRWQSADDVSVLGVDNEITGSWWREGRVDIEPDKGQSAVHLTIDARRVGFSLEQQPSEGAFLCDDRLIWRDGEREREVCTTGDLRLLGRHNIANVLAACAISGVAGAKVEAMRQVATTFTGVAHRLELVREHAGVRWYNDSIATTPERTLAALKSFGKPLVLLAGGRDKHLPWDEMADLAMETVRHLVLFGEAADLVSGQIEAARRRAVDRATAAVPGPVVHQCLDLDGAVRVAARVSREGDIVLLSPGGTSFDAYRDFEERGRHFGRLVNGL